MSAGLGITCECWGGNCAGAGPHGSGDDDNCKAEATAGFVCEEMLSYLCDPCGRKWEADGDWKRQAPPARAASESGQSLIEFALVLPLFILLVSGLVSFGTFLFKQQAAASLATIVCRDASIHGAPHARTFGADLAGRLGVPAASITVTADVKTRRVSTIVTLPYRALLVHVPVRAERSMAREGGAL